MIVEFIKEIPGYNGYYASDLGLIYSTKKGSFKEKKFYEAKDGYSTVGLTPNGGKHGRFKAHRMIALTWLPNPDNLPTVNHINFDKRDNRVENLEWASHTDQINHNHKHGRSKTTARAVVQADEDGNLIAEFESMTDAAFQTGLRVSCISAVCLGKQRMTGGYVWYYKDEFKGQKMRKYGNCKTVLQYETDGEFVRTFESVNEAAAHVGCNASTLATACRGKQATCMGYVWKYEQKEKKEDPEEKYKKWKRIPGYSKYRISKDGQVYSSISKRLLKATKSEGERMTVHMKPDDRKKGKPEYIHRLVALAYLPNPENHPIINHIDGDPSNNIVDNLEWCSYSHNSKHAFDAGLNKNRRPIVKLSPEGEVLERFKCAGDAAETLGVSRTALAPVLRGDIEIYKGFRWEYDSNTLDEYI